MATKINTILDWFKAGKKPTQGQFWDSWQSFWHKDEEIPQSSISNLVNTLGTKAEKSQLENHKIDKTAHNALFEAKEDKTQKGAADGYAPLNSFKKLASQYLEIVNDLVSGGSASLLSAEQGKLLQNQINGINILLASENVNLNTVQEIVDAIENIQSSLNAILVNDLTTGGITKALTAEMGKVLNQNKEDKSQKGAASGYVPLNELVKIASQYLTIINDLTTGGAESLLSAEQGKLLQNQINGINSLLSSDNINLDTIQEIVDAIETVQVSLSTILVNDLTTGGVTKALTAEMGKQLDQIKLTATIATDAETQTTVAVDEDKKIVSRSKLFNWWEWIKDQSTTITGDWTFTGSLKANTNKEINLNTSVNFDYYTGSSSIKLIHSKNVANENGIYLKTNGDLKLEGEKLEIINSGFRGRIYDNNGEFCIDGQSIPLNLSGESVQIGWRTYIHGEAYYKNSEIATLNDLAETYQEQNCGPFTSQDLNGMYYFAKKGFRLHCIYALGGPVCYEKLDTGYWVKYPVTLV